MSIHQPTRILCHPASSAAGDLYRISGPADALQTAGLATIRIERCYLSTDELLAVRPDVIVLQHQYHDEQIAEMKRYRAALPGAAMLYEIDDLLWNLPDTNPHKAGLPKDIKRRIRECLGICDGVVVSTSELGDAIQRDFGYAMRGKPVRVCLNTITTAFLAGAEEGRREARQVVRKDPRLRVGWAGNVSHAADLAFLSDIIRATHDRIQWVFMGMVPAGVEDLVEAHPLVSLDRYPAALAALALDLAVAPYSATNFDECKSNLRILELGAAGFPVLTNRDFPGAITLEKAKWPAFFDRFLGIQEHARDTLHRQVRDNHSFESVSRVREWAQAWEPKNRVAFLATGRADGDARLVNSPEGFREAAGAPPAGPILYVRPGADASDESIAEMLRHGEVAGIASLQGWSNDADYPVAGAYTTVTPRQARDIELSLPEGETVAVPYAAGPLVLLTAAALARVGYPDVDRYPDVEVALMEWGVRARRAGMHHLQVSGVWVTAPPIARSNEALQGALRDVTFWYPETPRALEVFRSDTTPALLRAEADKNLFRIGYEAPPTPTYEEWAKLHNDGGLDQLPAAFQEGTHYPIRIHPAVPVGAGWIMLINAPQEPHTARRALRELLAAVEANPDAVLAYADHDVILDNVRRDPWFKTEWNYEATLGQDPFGPILLVRRDLYDTLGLRPDFGAAALYDLALRVIAQEVWNGGAIRRDRVVRVPLVLSSLDGAAPCDPAAERRAVLEHLQAVSASAAVVPHPEAPDERLVRWLPRASATADVILDGGLTDAETLNSILTKTAFQQIKVYVTDPTGEAEARFGKLAGGRQAVFIRALADITERSEFTCYVTGPISVVEPSWLHDLVGLADRAGVISLPRFRMPDGQRFEGLGVLEGDGILVDVLHGAAAGETAPHGFGRHTAEWRAVRPAPVTVIRTASWGDVPPRFVVAWPSVLVNRGGRVPALYGTPEALNPNLEPVPTLGLPRTLPPRPWRSAEPARRVLVVNSDDFVAEALRRFPLGDLCSGASVEGTTLTFTLPHMPNIPPIDVDEDLVGAVQVLGRMGIESIELHGAEKVSLGALRAFGAMRASGLPVAVPPGAGDDLARKLIDQFGGAG